MRQLAPIALSMLATLFMGPVSAATISNNSGAGTGSNVPAPKVSGNLNPYMCSGDDDSLGTFAFVLSAIDPISGNRTKFINAVNGESGNQCPCLCATSGGVWTQINQPWDTNSSISFVWQSQGDYGPGSVWMALDGRNKNNGTIGPGWIHLSDVVDAGHTVSLGSGYYKTTLTKADWDASGINSGNGQMKNITTVTQFETVVFDYDGSSISCDVTTVEFNFGDYRLTKNTNTTSQPVYGPTVQTAQQICPEAIGASPYTIVHTP